MLQIIVTIVILFFVLGGLFALSMSRGERKEFNKSCNCSLPDAMSNDTGCVNHCG